MAVGGLTNSHLIKKVAAMVLWLVVKLTVINKKLM
jgi:hypothetical protein